MNDFFFSENECGIADKVPKGDFDFVISCDILPPPPPLSDCVSPLIFPEPVIPCPRFNVKSEVSTSLKADDDDCEETSVKFDVESKTRCEPNAACEFELDFDLHIQIPQPPCPEINIKLFNVEADFEDCKTGDNKFVITKRDKPGTCEEFRRCIFDIELEIFIPIPRVPCPEISVTTFEIDSGYSNSCEKDSRFRIIRRPAPRSCDGDGDCIFDVDLEIWVPLPPIECPKINIKKFEVTTSYEICPRGKNRFEITTRHTEGTCKKSPDCVFDVELEIDVPIPLPSCPKIEGTLQTLVRYSDVRGRGGSYMRIKRTEQEGCESGVSCTFVIDIFVDVPIPRVCCPVINPVSQISVGYGFPTFAILKVTDQSECFRGTPRPPVCRFILTLEISVGLPLPPCPKFSPEVELVVLRPDQTPYAFFDPVVVIPQRLVLVNGGAVLEPCEIKIKLQLGVPQPCDLKIMRGTDELRKVGCDVEDSHLELMIERLGFCEYKIWLYGWIPPACKPVGGSSSVEYCDCECGASGGSSGGSEGDPDGSYNWGSGDPDIMPLRAAITDYDPGTNTGTDTPSTTGGGCGNISIEVQPVGAGEEGGYKLVPKLTIPKTQCITGGTVTISPAGLGSGTVTLSGSCEDKKLDIQINLNVSDCSDSPSGPTGPTGPETGPDMLPFTANPAAANLVATKEQIRQTLLDGLKLTENGEPVDLEFYTQITDVIRTVIAK